MENSNSEDPGALGPLTALDGIRVLDFTHALAGPYCTLLLSDYGATVYKLESPDGGDIGRGWGPPFRAGHALYFLGLNRGKYGISINLKRPEGVKICLDLIDRMDVLIENFRPGTMDRLGLGYETVRTRNPRLIYCSITGYGQKGPMREEPAMDLIVQASSGLISVTGTETGDPVRCGYSVADVSSGMMATIGILIALRARERTGKGQFVDVAMLDSMISAMTSNYMTCLGTENVPRPLGTAFSTIVPYQTFSAQDRSIAIAVGSEKLWATFCSVIGRPDLETHPDYATNADRVRNRGVLVPMLADIFRRRPAGEWIRKFHSAGLPCSPVRTLPEVAEDEQANLREMFPVIEHPTAGSYKATGSPVKLSGTPARAASAAPLLGQHTRQVLACVLGLSDGTIDHLADSGIILEPGS